MKHFPAFTGLMGFVKFSSGMYIYGKAALNKNAMNVGETIDGKYLVLDNLGEGGMGKVMKVRNIISEQEFALKYCKESDDSSIRRFAREVRIMSETLHSNIIPVVEHNLTNIPPYFIMPLASTTLKDLIPAIRGDAKRIFGFFYEVCNGISAMHNSGHFHRDIKPSNVLLLQNGEIAISDFGLAKKVMKDSSTHSSSNNFLGTYGYHAPEQIDAKNADARTDIYQLGKTLYELFTGDYPHLIDPSKISPGLNYIIQKATSVDPNGRYQSVSDLQQVIKSYELSIDPNANPSEVFANKINEVNNLLRQGHYNNAACLSLLDILDKVKENPTVFIEYFDKIPIQIIKVLANNLNEQFESTLATYSINLFEYISVNRVDFSYAEDVAEKMSAVFYATSRLDFKAIAMKQALIIAVRFNRYRAMDVFDSLLQYVKTNDVALAIADLLRTEMDSYSRLYNRVSKNNLHYILQIVWDEAEQYIKDEKERRDKETQEWLREVGF